MGIDVEQAVGLASRDFLLNAKLLGILSGIGTVVIFHFWARRTLKSLVTVWAATLVIAGDHWLGFWAAGSMESSFGTMLAVGVFFLISSPRKSTSNLILTGSLLGLSVLSRRNSSDWSGSTFSM